MENKENYEKVLEKLWLVKAHEFPKFDALPEVFGKLKPLNLIFRTSCFELGIILRATGTLKDHMANCFRKI